MPPVSVKLVPPLVAVKVPGQIAADGDLVVVALLLVRVTPAFDALAG